MAATTELVKSLIVTGEPNEATTLLNNLVKKLYPDLMRNTRNVGGFPYPKEVQTVDTTLGMLLILTGSMNEQMRLQGIKSSLQRRVYNVSDKGLLSRPSKTEWELIHGSSSSSYKIDLYCERVEKEKLQKQKQKQKELNAEEDVLSKLRDKARRAAFESLLMMKECDTLISLRSLELIKS